MQKFTVKRTLSRSAAAWLATKQNGCLSDLKQGSEEKTNEGLKSVLVVRIGGISASGMIIYEHSRFKCSLVKTVENFL